MKEGRKRAFSYLRFSDRKQAKGDSLRRQLEWGPLLCARKGWDLQEEFKLQDEGVSAFRGKNATKGALARFKDAVESGKVVAGDVLLVENLDRLSREDIEPAWEAFAYFLRKGVDVYTREPERHYVKADLNNLGTRIEVQAYMLRAYSESATKSMRGREYWKGKRAEATEKKKPIHKVLPAWLRLSKDRQQIEVIPEAEKAIKLIYKWAGEGLGLNAITARLNEEGIKPIGNNIRRTVLKTSWRRSYVAKLLQEKTVVGEFQPHVLNDGKRVPQGDPIPDYFPQVISEEEWYRVRQAVRNRGKELGPKGVGIASLFTGLIHDARDGQKMHLVYAGSSRKNNTRTVLSYGTRNGEPGSMRLPFPYDAVEKAFLRLVRELKVSDLSSDNLEKQEQEMATVAGKLKELEEKISAVQERAMKEKGIDALFGLLERLDKERKETAAELERLKTAAGNQRPAVLEDAQSLIDLLEQVEGEELISLRTKVKARIKQLISEVWMLVWDATPTIRVAEADIFFNTGKVKGFVLVWFRKGKLRGHVAGGGSLLVAAGKPMRSDDLREYRKNEGLREAYKRKMADYLPRIEEYRQAHETYLKAKQEFDKLDQESQ
jgi:DNA invertase Pin-like site-specific DNA recombinase